MMENNLLPNQPSDLIARRYALAKAYALLIRLADKDTNDCSKSPEGRSTNLEQDHTDDVERPSEEQ